MPPARSDAPGCEAPLRITVLINVYNYERFLGEAIRSALDQDYPHVDVVVVDDGSTDNSRSVIALHPGAKAVLKENGGQNSAVRAGLDHVTGAVVILLDADDWLLPHACSRIAEVWRPELRMVQFQLEKRRGAEVQGLYPNAPFLHGGEQAFVLKHGFIPSSPTSGNAFATSHVRATFQHNEDDPRGAPDGVLIFTATALGGVLSLDEVLGVYRLHGANKSGAAGGASVKSMTGVVRTEVAHARGLARMTVAEGVSDKAFEAYLSPYTLRQGLFLRRGFGIETLPSLSTWSLAIRGLRGFARFPRISPMQRLKNMALLVAALVGPSALSRSALGGAAPPA